MVDLTQRGIKNIVKYSGLKELNLIDQTKLKNIFENEYEKIHRLYGNNTMDLSVNVKIHDKGKTKKYSIHSRIEGPSKIISAESYDMDITAVSRDIIKKLKNELQKQFKEEGKRWKGIKDIIRNSM